MTPKEKAKEILDKMRVHQVWGRKDFGNVKMYLRAKECALICVEEILSIQVVKNGYWNEVKIEIKNL